MPIFNWTVITCWDICFCCYFCCLSVCVFYYLLFEFRPVIMPEKNILYSCYLSHSCCHSSTFYELINFFPHISFRHFSTYKSSGDKHAYNSAEQTGQWMLIFEFEMHRTICTSSSMTKKCIQNTSFFVHLILDEKTNIILTECLNIPYR